MKNFIVDIFKINPTINSIYFLLRIIWGICSAKKRIQILLVFIFSIFSSIIQYVNIILTATTFAFITSLSYTNTKNLEFEILFGKKLFISNDSLLLIILIWLISSLINYITVIFSTFLIYKVSYSLGNFLSKKNLRLAINSNSLFYENISEKTLFNLLTSENQMLIKGPIMSLIGLPMQIATLIALLIILLTKSNPIFFATLPCIAIIYFFTSNFLFHKVRKNSELVFDLRSKQTDILSRITYNYLDVAFPPSGKYYTEIFSRTTSKLRNLESFNAIVPRVIKAILELGIILIIGFYIIYSVNILKLPLENFIGSSAAIIITIFKLTPIISNLSSTLMSFNDKYESIKNYYQLIFKNDKFNLYSSHFKYSTIDFNSKYKLIFDSIKSSRISKYSKNKALSMNLESKKLLWITGQSGCGKSTLLSMIAGIRPIEKGEIKLILRKNKLKQNANYIHEHVGYMPQKPIFHSLTVAEYIKDGDEKINFNTIKNTLVELNLTNSFGMNIKQLSELVIGPRGYKPSGGQGKLLSFARVLCKRNVNIYLLDEPTSDLNNDLRDIVLNLIYELSKNKFVLCITHDLKCIRKDDEKLEL